MNAILPFCHSRESGNLEVPTAYTLGYLDSRFRGNDRRRTAMTKGEKIAPKIITQII